MPFPNIDFASIMGWLDSAATQQWIVGILLVFLFISFIREWLPVEITALAGTAVLMLTGILTTGDVLSSFANSGPLTVVCMFILSASLERTGLIGDLSKLFNKVAKGREFAALLVITLGAFAVSPFVNNTPVVVILMPIVLAFCRDHNIAASKLLIPLSYATILGGTCSVVGTSTNVVVLGQVQKLGFEGIQMFTVAPWASSMRRRDCSTCGRQAANGCLPAPPCPPCFPAASSATSCSRSGFPPAPPISEPPPWT